uniref:Nuclear receptor domain-containing protein n=1 Tax=Panagrellus redivivus TaxID=6233 RepID=A0A7E4VSI1_PANRE
MNKDTRTRCQKCRFQKCLDAGMKPELVHPKKSKKAGKENEPDQETLRLCHQLTKMISTAFNASFGNVVDEIKKGDTPALLDADFDELKRMATKFVSKFVEVGEEEREKLVDSSLRAFLAVIGAYVISQRDELATAHVFNQDPMTVADMNEVKDMLDFEHMTADTLAIVAAMTFTISTPKISTEAREAITKLHERFTTSYSFMSNDVQNSSGMPAIYSFANSMRKFY